MKREFTSIISDYLYVYFTGLGDALSFHKCIPVLATNHDALIIVIKILAANLGLVVGSVYLFDQAIYPMVNFLTPITETIEEIESDLAMKPNETFLWFVYKALWLFPICILCYVCSMAWYQELADKIIADQIKKGNVVTKEAPLLKSVGNTIYGILTWLFVYIQVQLLLTLLPSFFAFQEYILHLIFHDPVVTADVVQSTAAGILKRVMHTFFLVIVRTINGIIQFIGLSLMSLLYAWYSFDPKWISQNKDPDQRFLLLEKYAIYFLGFGTPFVLLNKCASFFIGFGGFLTVFPFCIILGTVLNYKESYETYDVAPFESFRVFKLAQIWTLYALKLFGTARKTAVSVNASLGNKTKQL
jgi:hypothetical protein